MAEKHELNEEELAKVLGGVKTGDVKGDAVYFEFPSFISSMSGYYTCADIEKLCKDYYDYRSIIGLHMNDAIRNAVKKLYGNNPIPQQVKDVLGIK